MMSDFFCKNANANANGILSYSAAHDIIQVFQTSNHWISHLHLLPLFHPFIRRASAPPMP
nr:MAG TPA: hypothetical protein [Caudoviricetes sp.]